MNEINRSIRKAAIRLSFSASRLTLLGLFIFFSLPSFADDKSSKVFGDYIVHHSIFNSTFILPDIAKIHGITRAEDQVLINLSIHQKADNKAVPAAIEGTAKNLMQQLKSLNFKEIREPGAVYYIANLRTTNREVFHFDFDITPEGQTESFKLKLTKKLWKDI